MRRPAPSHASWGPVRCSSSHRVESKVPMSCRFAGGFCWQRRCRDSPARERVMPSPAAAEYASREGGYVQRTRGGERKHTCFVACSGEVGGLDAARNGKRGGNHTCFVAGAGGWRWSFMVEHASSGTGVGSGTHIPYMFLAPPGDRGSAVLQ